MVPLEALKDILLCYVTCFIQADREDMRKYNGYIDDAKLLCSYVCLEGMETLRLNTNTVLKNTN